MTLKSEIDAAFSHRTMPERVLSVPFPRTGDEEDGQWFLGREQSRLVRADWEKRSAAFFMFTPAAFLYYLPSILKISTENVDDWFLPADSLLQILDRSPIVEYWDKFMIDRLVGLSSPEYSALESWLLKIAEGSAYDEYVDRSFDTVALLKSEAEKSRNILKRLE